MFISLMGMSGTGKSYWSQKFEEMGFRRFGCDEMISDHLLSKLGIPESEFEMHAWVGFPTQEKHAEHARLYFETEVEVMHEILDYLHQADPEENIVIDTTGSAIYTPSEIMSALAEKTTMVYLAVSENMIDQMLEKYLQKPVAVLWNGLFEQKAGEALHETFSRCYPILLNSRDHLYRKYAHQIIGPEFHRAAHMTAEELVNLIQTNAVQRHS